MPSGLLGRLAACLNGRHGPFSQGPKDQRIESLRFRSMVARPELGQAIESLGTFATVVSPQIGFSSLSLSRSLAALRVGSGHDLKSGFS